MTPATPRAQAGHCVDNGYDAVADTMTRQALVLGAISAALSLDLAIAPVILSGNRADFGKTMLSGLATSIGAPLRDLGKLGAKNDMRLPTVATSLVVIEGDERAAMTDFLTRLEAASSAPVVLVIVTSLAGETAVLDAIEDVLRINRAHVPTARLDVSQAVTQPVLVNGFVSHEGSKCGLRFFSVSMLPHDAELRFTVEAEGDMSDDELNAALETLFGHNVHAALRLEQTDDGLHLGLNAFDVMD